MMGLFLKLHFFCVGVDFLFGGFLYCVGVDLSGTGFVGVYTDTKKVKLKK